MARYKYLIVGGGMAADSAAIGIREVDPDGSIGLIGSEPQPPYNRPPLSKGLWAGKALESIWRKTESRGVALHLGRSARALDLANREITDDQGTVYGFEKLLLATGGTPRKLPFGDDRVIYFRTFDDYLRLRALAGGKRKFAIIGGGFIGSEVAAALAMNGEEVTMLFPEASIGTKVFPRELSEFLTGFYREMGVEVLPGQTVAALEPRGERIALKAGGATGTEVREILVDAVVAGLGIQPNVELARSAGLEVGNGILVDEQLRAGHPDVYAAGDVASFHNPSLGKRLRLEHEDNANSMGRLAGRSMAGEMEPYHHLPFFYSDMFDLGYEAVGDLDPRLETVVDWKEPNREGVVYYVGEGRVRGVLLWNVWEQVDAARRLIAEPGPFRPEDLVGRLPQSR